MTRPIPVPSPAPVITHAWARSVLRDQRRLLAELRAMPRPDGRKLAPEPAPVTLADLERKDHRTCYTSRYRGVTWNRYAQLWYAYIPRTSTSHKKPVGRYDNELEAAKAVVAAMNGERHP